MTTHDTYGALLATRGDLSPAEQADLDRHLSECPTCRDTATAYTRQDDMLRTLPLAPLHSSLQNAIVQRAIEHSAGRRLPWPGHVRFEATGGRFRSRVSWLTGAVAAVAVILAAVLHPGGSNVTTANAYDLLRAAAAASAQQFPYSGTSEVSYRGLPQYTLPDAAARVTGQHRSIVRWKVQDSSHFRVDIQTILPAMDAGRETVVVKGDDIYRYDTRTETAAVSTLYPFIRKSFLPQLLPYLRTGAAYGQAPEPDPSQSIQNYLAQQETARAKFHGYARVVGHGRFLGRKVDIVQFAPLVISCDKSARNNVCAVPTQGYGVGKAWIDHAHPFVLQYREYGFGGLHGLQTDRINFVYRVTSIHYGVGPTRSDLAFAPPVPIRNAGHWSIGSMEGTFLPHNGRFIYAPSPSAYAHLDWVQPGGMAGGQYIGPLPEVTEAFMLYSVRGRHVITYLHKGDRYGFGLYVTGPYVYVEERTQVHGLPWGLKTGRKVTMGRCQMWSATSVAGHQVAFQHGQTSVLVLSNVLPPRTLLQYTYHSLCVPRW